MSSPNREITTIEAETSSLPPFDYTNWGDPTFILSTNTTGALARLRDLFARQNVPWVAPTSQQDQSKLGNVAHKIDLYFDSKAYVEDLCAERELFAMALIMRKEGGGDGRFGPRSAWAVCRNAVAFREAARRGADAAAEAEVAAWEEVLSGWELERRQGMVDEKVLREVNQYEVFVEGVLDRLDGEDEIDEDEFQAAFASGDEGEGEEGEDEGEDEDGYEGEAMEE